MAAGAIYGTRDAGRQWYLYARKVLAAAGLQESRLEKGLYMYYDKADGKLAAVIHSHVDDFLIASRNSSKEWSATIKELEKKLHLKPAEGEIKYCGRVIYLSLIHI